MLKSAVQRISMTILLTFDTKLNKLDSRKIYINLLKRGYHGEKSIFAYIADAFYMRCLF